MANGLHNALHALKILAGDAPAHPDWRRRVGAQAAAFGELWWRDDIKDVPELRGADLRAETDAERALERAATAAINDLIRSRGSSFEDLDYSNPDHHPSNFLERATFRPSGVKLEAEMTPPSGHRVTPQEAADALVERVGEWLRDGERLLWCWTPYFLLRAEGWTMSAHLARLPPAVSVSATDTRNEAIWRAIQASAGR